jgi:anti-sigma regulatory factor (Ser/Thr protein kinase)
MVIARDINDISELRAARNEWRRFLESRSLPADVTYDLLTCVQEACKNALRFADSPRGVRASVAVDSNEIVATVRDYGAGLDIGSQRPAAPDPYSESGRGLFLMAELMDRVEFQVDHGTRVRLHKRLPANPLRSDRVA